MRRALTIILVIGLSYSCFSQNKPIHKTLHYCGSDTLIPFSGYYLCEKYINLVKQNKSPKLSQGSAECITIPDSTLKFSNKNDFHEGLEIMVVKKGPTYQLLRVNSDDTTFKKDSDYINAQNILVISNNKIKIGNDYFDKLNPYDCGLGEILFKGKYQSEKGSIVEFSSDGGIKGLNGYKIYSIMTDYIDVNRDADQISLGTTENDMKDFAFKFQKDTLLIYDLKHLNEGTVDFGRLKYKLAKKN